MNFLSKNVSFREFDLKYCRCFVSCGLLLGEFFYFAETTSSMAHHVKATQVLGWLQFWNNIQLQHVAYKILADPVTVTSRIILSKESLYTNFHLPLLVDGGIDPSE